MKVVLGKFKIHPQTRYSSQEQRNHCQDVEGKENVNIIYPLPKRRKAISTGVQSLDNCQGEKDVLPAGLLNLPK